MRHLWIVCFLGVFGATGLITAAWQAVRTLKFLRAAHMATGKVVRLKTMRVGRRRKMVVYVPTIRFQTLDRQAIEFTARTGASPPDYSIGETVRIKYLPNKPTASARIESFWDIWCLTVVSLFIGAILTLMTLSVYLGEK